MRIWLSFALLCTCACAVRQLPSHNWRLNQQTLIPPHSTAALALPKIRQIDPVDLTPPIRIQVVSPILHAGPETDAPITEITGTGNSLNVTAKSSDNLVGFETAWYEAQPAPHARGYMLTPLYAERNIQGTVERRPLPATDYFHFESGPAFYGLFYKAGQTDYTALVIAAPSMAELDRIAAILETGPVSCEKLDRQHCVAIPRRLAINPPS